MAHLHLDTAIQQLRRGDLLGAVLALSNHATSATRLVHTPLITPVDALAQPGQGPALLVMGTTVTLHFDTVTDKAYRVFKIPPSYVGSPAFHVHWTKAVNSDESGHGVRWRLNYKVFDGSTQDISDGTIQTVTVDDTYDDTGTTTRIVHRTANIPALGFVAGYYVGLQLDYVAGSTTLVGGPVCVSLDLTMEESINLDTD